VKTSKALISVLGSLLVFHERVNKLYPSTFSLFVEEFEMDGRIIALYLADFKEQKKQTHRVIRVYFSTDSGTLVG